LFLGFVIGVLATALFFVFFLKVQPVIRIPYIYEMGAPNQNNKEKEVIRVKEEKYITLDTNMLREFYDRIIEKIKASLPKPEEIAEETLLCEMKIPVLDIYGNDTTTKVLIEDIADLPPQNNITIRIVKNPAWHEPSYTFDNKELVLYNIEADTQICVMYRWRGDTFLLNYNKKYYLVERKGGLNPLEAIDSTSVGKIFALNAKN